MPSLSACCCLTFDFYYDINCCCRCDTVALLDQRYCVRVWLLSVFAFRYAVICMRACACAVVCVCGVGFVAHAALPIPRPVENE